MFETLTEKLTKAMAALRGQASLTERNIEEALRNVRMALLEADVHVQVARTFLHRVKERAVGASVLRGLNPAQQFIDIVYKELTDIIGGQPNEKPINFSPKPPTVVMIVGLQGSGKTTTCAKLAKYLKKNGHSPLLAPADVNRPAAIEQLHIVAKEAGVQSFKTLEKTPVAICNAALEEAKAKGWDALIIDTAGRLHLDEALMDELALIKAACCPNEILFVADAMTGQDAVRSAESFNNKIGLTGVILTKTDGDSRGGAAFSIKQTLGRPIVFVGTGEKTDDFERFYPDRMAQRILGMGDVLTLIEHAKEKIGESEAERIAKRLESNQFSLEDMRSHFRQIQKLGSMNKLLGMIPGISQFKGQLENVITDKRMKHMEAILDSMTRKERQNHNLLDAKRKRRISLGSGRPVQEINQLLKQFQEMKKMMSQFANPGFRKKIQSFVGQNKFPFM